MGQGNTQFSCNQAEMIAAERRAVISVKAPGDAEPSYCHHQVTQETFRVLCQMKGCCHDIACGIVDNGVKISLSFIEALFDRRSMEKVSTPEVAEVGEFKRLDALGFFLGVAIQSLRGSEAIHGRTAGFTAVPHTLLQQFIKQALDCEKRVLLPLQRQSIPQRFWYLCPAMIFPLFVAQACQSQVLVTPEPQAQSVGGKLFLLSVGCVVDALRQSAQFPVQGRRILMAVQQGRNDAKAPQPQVVRESRKVCHHLTSSCFLVKKPSEIK